MLARLTSGTDVLTVQSGRLQLVSRSVWYGERRRGVRYHWHRDKRVLHVLTSLLFLLGEELYRQPRAVYKYWAGGYVPVTLQRQVPAVLRVRHPSGSVHRHCVEHSCYATETGIRSATVQVVGSVHSCFLAEEVVATLVVDIGSCMFRAGFCW